MAAYSYFPATYQNPYQQQFYGVQQQQIPQMPAQIPITQSGILWVGNEAEAQNYPVAPNNAVALWDSSRPAIYLKQADASGKPSMKTYELVERAETAQSAAKRPERAETPDYVTRREFDELWAALEEIRLKAESVKRTSVKKREVIENDAE